MHNKSDRIEVQVFLRNNEKNILKRFQRISNPKKKRHYGRYEEVAVISPKIQEKAKRFFGSWKDTKYSASDFPDIFTLWTTREELRKHRMPSFIETIEHEPNFEEVLYTWTSRARESWVEILPRLPSMGRTLKKRLNLECMIEGLRGMTLLAPIDSIPAEFPAVTVFTDQSCPKFSKDFERKEYADYQHDFVNIYLWDPEGKGVLRKLNFEKEGRASPDITLKDPLTFITLLQQFERPLGFLGYFLYQNAFAFRKVELSGPFPRSDSLWNANSGLGEPSLEELIKAFRVRSNP